MSLIDSLREELAYESSNTRKMLERLPAGDFGWKPHEKSMTLGRLAGHIAEIPHWAREILEKDELALDLSGYKPTVCESVPELLRLFDGALEKALGAMKGVSDERMLQPWRLKAGGQVLFELPRIAVFRTMILSHAIHHRGQLSVYLRLRNVPLPALYGPTADEGAT